jgi:hypothetical protein
MGITNEYFYARYSVILCYLMLLLLAGCSPERKLAKEYLRSHKGSRIFIVPSYELFKDNQTISYNDSLKYSEEQFDSIAWVQSCYIQHVSDSVFLSRFTNGLINELAREGFDVYVGDSSDAPLLLPGPEWIIYVAQLQLAENHTITTYEVYSEKVQGYEFEYADLRMNMISLSSWFESSHTGKGNKQVLYLEESIMDNRTHGFDFVLNKGNKGLQKNRDSLEMADIYKMADESGQKHAELLFDHFMNDYINENLPSETENKIYYIYDRKSHYLKHGLNQWNEDEK